MAKHSYPLMAIGSCRAVAMLSVAMLCCGITMPVHAESKLEQWRAQAATTRVLAENDAQAAFEEAKRLQAALPAEATPADQARVLNLLSRAEIYLADTEQADLDAKAALSIAKRNGDRIGQAEAYLNIATNAVNQGDIKALVEASTQSMVLVDGLNKPDILGEALLRGAMMYRRTGQVNESVELCVQAMEIAKRSRDPMALAYAHQCLGISFDQSDRLEDGLQHYKKMREFAHAVPSRILEAYALVGLGRAISVLRDRNEGKADVLEALRLFRAAHTPTGIAFALFNLSEIQFAQGLPLEALKSMNATVAIYERYPNKIGLWYVLNARSVRLQALGRYAEARQDIERAYALAKEIGTPFYNSESMRRKAEVYAQSGDMKRAYEASVEAMRLKEQFERDASSERILELTKRYQNESRQRQIDELTRSNEKQAYTLRQHELQQRWLWTVLASSMLILVGAAYFLLRLRRSHRLLELSNSRLLRSREQIQALNLSLEHRVEEQTAGLRQQTRYMRTLLDMLPMMTWLKDTSSRFLAVNQALASVGNSTVEEMHGKTDLDFFPQEMAQAYQADDREIMTTLQRKVIEEQIAHANRTIWIETFKAPVLDDDGTVLGTVGYAFDISDRKATEAAREEALAEAQRLAQLRSQFLAQMSHELRTPLNGILGYAQIMRRNKHLDERQTEGLNVIQQSGEHLLMLINDILEFAKIDAGKLDLTYGDMALGRFLRTIVSIISVRAEMKHLKFEAEIAPDLPEWVRADEKRLRQVLLNLLANAVKFTDHGQISFSVAVACPGRLRFEIADTGVGIAAAHLERIFQPFEQAGDQQRRAAGTGLGLAISRQLVRLMGGDIQVESQLGKGSVFSFEINAPIADAWKEAEPVVGRIVGYAGPRRVVLVVDDMAENRTVAGAMLAPLGFEIIEATNGREALEQARLHNPELILMDLVMPGMGGLDATRELRNSPGFEELPIIAVSASASGNDEHASLMAGMNAFLPKPVEYDRLLAVIARLLKLEWIYEPLEADAPAINGPIVAPPKEEMEMLHRLALQGSMRDILHMADHLTSLGEQYVPFAERLRTMAKGFQSKAILNFVEHYLAGGRVDE